jgi:hypothetical protein
MSRQGGRREFLLMRSARLFGHAIPASGGIDWAENALPRRD